MPGYNLRPLEISGAIGIEQIKKLPQFLVQRRLNAERFIDLFGKMRTVRVQKETGISSWFGFSMVLTDQADIERDVVVGRLANEGIETRPIVAGNFCRQPVIDYLQHEVAGTLSNANEIHDRGFYVGNCHIDLSPHLERLRHVLADVLKE